MYPKYKQKGYFSGEPSILPCILGERKMGTASDRIPVFSFYVRNSFQIVSDPN